MLDHQNDREKAIIKGVLFALLATLLWSGNFIVARGMYQKISPISLAFFRWLTATIFLWPVAQRSLAREWNLLTPHWKYICLTAITGITLFNTFVYIAGRYTSAMNLALIGTTAAPIFVLCISFLFLKEKIAVRQWLGALLCIIGMVLLISKGNLNQIHTFKISSGDVWILIAALSFAIYTVLVRRKPKAISALSFLFILFLVGTLFLLPAYIWEVWQGVTFNWNTDMLLIFLYLGIGASVIAFLLWNLSIHILGATRTALFGNLIPVFSSLEAVWLLHESFHWSTFFSFLLIIAGIVLANINVLKKQ